MIVVNIIFEYIFVLYDIIRQFLTNFEFIESGSEYYLAYF